ncbi:uncharacterized protein LOC113504136 isoform X2 [Trichoplusia ni]|uniref:Uncharacterized protein LOC113504136 isoform X2 n=1 Tax=Trichoplusia ni TaxID=7111 RepID=A0A7E5WPL4_TRINI|nr:uncharacterized protein LOC113504136 isoform X2 [Trichoplusia ni]
MFKEDDDVEEGSMGATRYNVMPSLVALQQMRNRLHLAFLGKKLMKWTALATGKELRRLSIEITGMIGSYQDDVATAFMLLARSRYFFPKMNVIVLENVPHTASLRVSVRHRGVAGVKVVNLDILESAIDPYPYLGIEKGGMTIWDAKEAWYNVLKVMIMLLEAKTTFNLVEIAHKNATKREKIIKNIVIPRIRATIVYMILELGETQREEMFRIKRTQTLRARRKEKKSKAVQTDPDLEIPAVVMTPPSPPPMEPPPLYPVPFVCCTGGVVCKETKLSRKLLGLRDQLNTIIQISKHFLDTGIRGNDITDFIRACEDVHTSIGTTCMANIGALRILRTRMLQLRVYLREMIVLSKDKSDEGIISSKFERFNKSCADFVDNVSRCSCSQSASREKPIIDIDQKATAEIVDEPPVMHIKPKISKALELDENEMLVPTVKEIKAQIEISVKTDSNEFEKPLFVDQVMSKTDVVCENGHKLKTMSATRRSIDEHGDQISKESDLQEMGELIPMSTDRLEEFRHNITNIIEMTKYYQSEGLLDSSAEAFTKSCETVLSKIDDYKSLGIQKVKSESLKEQNTNLEMITSTVKEEQLVSPSIESFLEYCKRFKELLKDDDKVVNESDGSDKLVSEVNETIVLSKEANQCCPICASAKESIGSDGVVYDLNKTIELSNEAKESFLGSPVNVSNGSYKLTPQLHEKNELSDDAKQGGLIGSPANESVDLDKFITHLNRTIELSKEAIQGGILSTPTNESVCLGKLESQLNETIVLSKDLIATPANESVGSDKLVSQLNDTIELSKEAKQGGLVGNSVEDFIQGCEEIKQRLGDEEDKIESQVQSQREVTAGTKVLDELTYNIDDIMNMISQYKAAGLVSESVEEFFRNCQMTKAKIDFYKEYPPETEELQFEEQLGSVSCICATFDKGSESCDRCREMLLQPFYQYPKDVQNLSPPPCYTCRGLEEPPQEKICKTCFEEPDLPFFFDAPCGSGEHTICDTCRKRNSPIKVKRKEKRSASDDSSPDDDKIVRKIIRIKSNQDGNVQKDKNKTKTTKKQRQNPHESIWTDDDEDYCESDSYDSVLTDAPFIGNCQVPNAQGFVRVSKSEDIVKSAPFVDPELRQCVSADTLLSKNCESEMVDVDLDVNKSFSVVSSSNYSLAKSLLDKD